MRMATIREVKAKLGEYMALARKDLVVITRHGRAAAVLQAIDPADLEEVICEVSDRFRKLITSRRRIAPAQRIPLEKIAARRRRTRPGLPDQRRRPDRSA